MASLKFKVFHIFSSVTQGKTKQPANYCVNSVHRVTVIKCVRAGLPLSALKQLMLHSERMDFVNLFLKYSTR